MIGNVSSGYIAALYYEVGPKIDQIRQRGGEARAIYLDSRTRMDVLSDTEWFRAGYRDDTKETLFGLPIYEVYSEGRHVEVLCQP